MNMTKTYFEIWPKNEVVKTGELIEFLRNKTLNSNKIKIIGDYLEDDAIHAIIIYTANSLKAQLKELDSNCDVWLTTIDGNIGWDLTVKTTAKGCLEISQISKLFNWKEKQNINAYEKRK